MGVISSDSLAGRSALGVTRQLSEFIYVCAIYLGIAVLITVVFGASVPSLREQVRQVHEALVIALRPAGDFKQGWLASYGGNGDGWHASEDQAALDEEGAVPPEDVRAARRAEAATRPAAASPLSFSEALKASTDGRHVAGITAAQAQALRSYIARKYKIAHSVAGALVNTVFVVAREKQLDPQLVLAVIAIESRYNPYAESHVGAQGLMQVMTKVHQDKFEVFSDGPIAALNPIANIRVGVQILYDCIKRRGSVEGGLACYVGATGPSDGGYGAKVLAERRRIALASGIPVGR
ncbi:lytic transglycosylase domain-containing protein [Pusillimonas sp. SM2304]|uniref:lytic transglycosylase domain-containing protein n=1 Tax=Pusillimonas sp. SM2304 TaxID=3073241 RepID=UPI00287486BD|nr:lytic transglycosylase domain-containing protein [Pusillimonas sp. SM2304]MDS1140664.1 lytic transglycosylase domain-containing protein [Pusillimonas sp. SM2304]